MARIPDDELERIKRETDLVALVQAAGVALQRHGANVIGRCPFHDDQGPSLVVTPAKNLWHCLGACQAGGSVIDWVMRAERVSFRHAVELLRTRLGGDDAIRSAPAVSLTPLVKSVTEAQALDDTTLVREVLDFYHATLTASPEAIAYLEQRGLNSPALMAHFQLGYANRTLAYRLPATSRKAGAEVRGRLEQLGLIRASGHEHFRGSITVPIFHADGTLAQCYGRKIGQKLRDGTPLHLYLARPHTAVWNADALTTSRDIILCESLFDAMTFWIAGFPNVITSYGVSGFTDAHRAALRAARTERVQIAYDADAAGDRAATQVADELLAMGIACERVQFPRGMDANAYACASGRDASDALGQLLRGATWLGRGASPSVVPATAPIPTAIPPSSLAAAGPGFDAAPSPLTIERRGEEIVCTSAPRTYRVRGLAKNTALDALRVNVLVTDGLALHVDTLDLYVARGRALFIQQAAKELQVSDTIITREIGALILALESLVSEQRATTDAPAASPTDAPTMTDDERAAALDLLRDPQLLDRILQDFARAGVVGEETNKLMGYLAAVSRKLPEPLAIIIQSASAAGKTSLMDAVLAFVPPEERVQYSAMTGQALFYMAETNLQHKVLAVVEEEGAERASYALKLLQSEGELTIASTGKDPATGKLMTHEYRVRGPVMIMLTTTAVELDEELVNRALVLTVDEGQAQTRAIHQRQRQRRTLDGLLASSARAEVLALHRNAQRLLTPVHVVNPYAPQLTFVDARTRTRRDHEKYLTLIDTVAFLHQHQRTPETVTRHGHPLTYITVTREDIAVANRLADAVLGRSLDELPPQARKLLTLLSQLVEDIRTRESIAAQAVHFTRRTVRDFTGWTDFQVRAHLAQLESLEYVVAHRGARGQLYVYELLYHAERDRRSTSDRAHPRFLMGLRESDTLRGYDDENEGSHAENEPPSSPDGAASVPPSSTRPRANNITPARELRGATSRHPPRMVPEEARVTHRTRTAAAIGVAVVGE